MNRTSDPIHLYQIANPVPDPDQLPDGPDLLVKEIIGMTSTQTTQKRRTRRRPTMVLATALLAAAAIAAGTVALGSGFLDEPIATGETTWDGETWALTVGEEANDAFGNTFKVCHLFAPASGAQMANGFGTSGCEDVNTFDKPDSIFVDVTPAIEAPNGTVIFIDMTTAPVAAINAVLSDGRTISVEPFTMPASGKQFATIEVPNTETAITVQAVDASGTVLESRTLIDLTITRPAE